MATIDTKGLPQMLADQAAAAQASAGRALDFSAGSIMRAASEAYAAVMLWFQAMLLRVLATSRLATSSGEDVDSFIGDFGLTRTPAASAQGTVTLARFSPVAAAFVPVGALLRTSDGSVTFQVVADGAGYDAGAGGYTIPAGAGSLDVPVAAVTAGTAGNVNAGTVTLLASSLSGVDTVTNAAPMTGGADAETDMAAKARFPAYLASLSKATRSAIDYAVSQVQPGIRWGLIEGEDAAGSPKAANFVVVMDDGTGSAPPSLLSRTYSAVDAVRGLGITFDVIAADPLVANAAMTLTTAPGADHAAAVGRAAAAVNALLSGRDIGASLPFTRLPQVAYAADPSITNVSAVTLNGGTADLAPTARQVIVPGTVAVS
ncbi:baseplate J/gp47 family protein [Roseomonas chloroacetimidivorans]|uniref:baseplate J/gp47 family protein n=1 Tax=Roseomonas chloroacetimidivorans TaxID=1766656 RepID=UPI003C77C54A